MSVKAELFFGFGITFDITFDVTKGRFNMYIGIDLGGTNIAAGLVDENGKIIAKASTPTLAEREYPEIVKDMISLSEKLSSENGIDMKAIEAIGIGSPGSIDYKNGRVAYSNNLRFNNTPIEAEIKKYYDIPVVLENDANAAAFGEYIASGADTDSFVAITLGTGVGGGVIIDKKIYRGFNGAGAELGHFTLVHGGLPCTCGKCGCWESYASVTALIGQTKVAMSKYPESLMNTIAKEKGEVNGRTAFDAAKAGDAAAMQVVRKYTEYVADGIASIINIFQPQKLVVGGGISREGEYLLKPVIEYVRKYDYNKLFEKTEILTASLFNDAGIVGAALAAKYMR